MKIVLATGIYPPDIGGPATYCAELAKELRNAGNDVCIITYGKNQNDSIVRVPYGLPIFRWFSYAKELKKHGQDADIVYAFSSVSCGVPLILARLKGPKKVLRLGGDFFWERYTDRGGRLGLREWYSRRVTRYLLLVMRFILRHFDHIIFSTQFQQKIYHKHYKKLPPNSVIENALPPPVGNPQSDARAKHSPFRLLFMGRFVQFKNLHALLKAMTRLMDVRLTLIGDGPMTKSLKKKTNDLLLDKRVTFLPPISGEEKVRAFQEYDLLIIPSVTDISPNTALEACAAGMPVLLTIETGLTGDVVSGMTLARLIEPIDIERAVANAKSHYDTLVSMMPSQLELRTWQKVAEEHILFFSTLV
ncbi:MAG: glycosyltransferase family 4 protein [bacterium]|nr:glycosyltransferase family 4 protein [bacterium]